MFSAITRSLVVPCCWPHIDAVIPDSRLHTTQSKLAFTIAVDGDRPRGLLRELRPSSRFDAGHDPEDRAACGPTSLRFAPCGGDRQIVPSLSTTRIEIIEMGSASDCVRCHRRTCAPSLTKQSCTAAVERSRVRTCLQSLKRRAVADSVAQFAVALTKIRVLLASA